MHLNSELKKIREENLVLTTKLDSLQLQQPNFEAQGKMFKEYHDALNKAEDYHTEIVRCKRELQSKLEEYSKVSHRFKVL
jgi:hypothetical protein